MTRLALAAAAALTLISCHGEAAAPKRAPTPAHPALWKVSDADTTIYLFGTIHLLPEKLNWRTPRIDAAIGASQQLMLEVVTGDPVQTGAILTRLGQSPGLPPLLDRVPADTREALKAAVAKTGLPLDLLQHYESWAAALTLASVGFAKLNVSPDYGAEAVLTRAFTAQHKPIAGLETTEQQLGFFDTLPGPAQDIFLASIAEDDSHAQQEFDAMIGAWTAGDVRRIALTFDDELKLSPELTEALLTRRNANWANWIAGRMAQPGTIFIAVGAGHLAGSGSVENLLARRGFRVSRVQ